MAEDAQKKVYVTPTRCPHGHRLLEFCYQCEAMASAARRTKEKLAHHMELDPGRSRLSQFDAAAAVVNTKRGSVYGHPSVNFDRIQRLKAVVAECKHAGAREALDSICVKISRLIESPEHLDSWIDIAGYARTGVMATDSPRESETA